MANHLQVEKKVKNILIYLLLSGIDKMKMSDIDNWKHKLEQDKKYFRKKDKKKK